MYSCFVHISILMVVSNHPSIKSEQCIMGMPGLLMCAKPNAVVGKQSSVPSNTEMLLSLARLDDTFTSLLRLCPQYIHRAGIIHRVSPPSPRNLCRSTSFTFLLL